MRKKAALGGAFLGVVALLVLPGVLSRGCAGETLRIVSPHWDGIRYEFGRAFSERYLGRTGKKIRIDWIDQGGTGNCVRYVTSASDGTGDDVFFGGGAMGFRQLVRAESLVPFDAPARKLGDRLPDGFMGVPLRHPEYLWYGACLSGFGIAYNKRLLEIHDIPEPRVWKDLASPAARGWVSCADPKQSGTMHLMFEIILQAYGWEEGFGVLSRMCANAKAFNEGASAAARDVATAEAALAPCIDFYAWAKVSECGPENVGYVLPSDLTVVSVDPIGVLKGASNPEAARAFVEFVMEPPGQMLWYAKAGAPGGPVRFTLNRMPVLPEMYRKGTATEVNLDPFEWEKARPPDARRYDESKGGKRWAVMGDLFKATLMDVHDELRAAWKRAIARNDAGGFGSPVATEAEIDGLAAGWRRNPDRNRLAESWIRSTREALRCR